MIIIEKIKTFDDAMKATGRTEMPDLSTFPEDMRNHFEARYKMVVIVEALNEGWKPNWDKTNEKSSTLGFGCLLPLSLSTIRITTTRMRMQVAGLTYVQPNHGTEATPLGGITTIRAKKLGMGNSKMYYFT